MLTAAHIIFPESGRGIDHVTPKIFGIRSNISPKLLELQTSNLVGGFVLGMPSRRTNNFSEIGRGLGHVTRTILTVRSAILATAWLLVLCITVRKDNYMGVYSSAVCKYFCI